MASNNTPHGNGTASSYSNAALERLAKECREKSTHVSHVLTQKLASSDAGQNLLHIGTSLSTLPPDLHTLLTHLHPLYNTVESLEQHQSAITELVRQQRLEILETLEHAQQAAAASETYQDLVLCEQTLQLQEGGRLFICFLFSLCRCLQNRRRLSNDCSHCLLFLLFLFEFLNKPFHTI